DHDEAIRLDPKFADAFYNRGNAYENKGDHDRAIANYSEAIRLNPTNLAAALGNRANSYAKKGNQARAIADYNEALRLDPTGALNLCNRGKTKLRMNDRSGNSDIAKARQLDASACR